MELTAPKIVGPKDGKAGFLGSIGVRFMTFGDETGERFSLVEHPMGPRALAAPLHLHTREDEYSIVTEGEIGFRSGDREVVLGAGGYITKPRGELHAMWNAGDTPARMIEIISPAGFERFFADVVDLMEADDVSDDAGARLLEAYGLRFEEPDWLADVITRYGLPARDADRAATASRPPSR